MRQAVTPPWLLVAGDFRPGGGMDQANYRLAWHLAESLGRDVTLVAHHVASPLADHPRVRFVKVSRPLRMHTLGTPLLDWVGRQEADRLRTLDPRARVVVNGGNCLWPAVNWVHMVHHACGRADSGTPWLFRLKNGVTRAWARRRERRALAESPLVIANSHKTRRELIDLVGVSAERIRVVYLASDPARFHPVSDEERAAARRAFGLPADALVVLFVGALGYDRNKGFDTLLRAWRRLPNEGGVLVAAGGGQLGHWAKVVEGMGLASSVRLVGHTDRLAELMTAADLLVSPTRYDAYGLAVHEALCRGLPAVVTRAAGVAERYPANLSELILEDPENDADLAERLRRCRDGLAGLRERVADFGVQLRSRTWDDVARDMVGLIRGGPMIILSHRGYWKIPSEKNSACAFARSFHLGFGTETDLRDRDGRLVIAHDPPGADALPAEAFFGIHAGIEPGLPLALNIKADGLQSVVKEALERFRLEAAFVFDMAVPDARGYLSAGVPVFTRHSELEREPPFYEAAAGVWVDGFESDWVTEREILAHLAAGKRVCLVSPELHRRHHRPLWDRVAAMRCAADPRLMLCTDFPEEARRLFHA